MKSNNNLRKFRELQRYTQMEIAKMLHISRPTYIRYELEGVIPPYDILYKLARFYEVPVSYLITFEEE